MVIINAKVNATTLLFYQDNWQTIRASTMLDNTHSPHGFQCFADYIPHCRADASTWEMYKQGVPCVNGLQYEIQVTNSPGVKVNTAGISLQHVFQLSPLPLFQGGTYVQLLQFLLGHLQRTTWGLYGSHSSFASTISRLHPWPHPTLTPITSPLFIPVIESPSSRTLPL